MYTYITYKNMDEPVDIYPIDRDEMGEEDNECGDDLMNDLEIR